MLTVTTLDHTDGLVAVRSAMNEIEESIVESGGSFKVAMEVSHFSLSGVTHYLNDSFLIAAK